MYILYKYIHVIMSMYRSQKIPVTHLTLRFWMVVDYHYKVVKLVTTDFQGTVNCWKRSRFAGDESD